MFVRHKYFHPRFTGEKPRQEDAEQLAALLWTDMTPLLPELLATGFVSGLFFLLSSLKLYLENICSLQWWQVLCCG